jgi:hypothetical protein
MLDISHIALSEGTLDYIVILRIINGGTKFVKAKSNLCLADFTMYISRNCKATDKEGTVPVSHITRCSGGLYYSINYCRSMYIVIAEQRISELETMGRNNSICKFISSLNKFDI